MKNQIREKIINILLDEVGLEFSSDEFDEEEDLANYGLNSSMLLELIANIENEFSIEFIDDDFDSDNFRNLNCIVNYVDNKLNY